MDFEKVDFIEKAFNIALKAHEGQIDKGRFPYIFHPVWVALHCETEKQKVVALLHDTIEDSIYSINDLRRDGFSDEVIDAVEAITRFPDEEYMTYIKRCAKNKIAKKVKILDLTHNMDLSRIQNPCIKDKERVEKYAIAKNYLDRVNINIGRRR